VLLLLSLLQLQPSTADAACILFSMVEGQASMPAQLLRLLLLPLLRPLCCNKCCCWP
jgi:hypothetical protein